MDCSDIQKACKNANHIVYWVIPTATAIGGYLYGFSSYEEEDSNSAYKYNNLSEGTLRNLVGKNIADLMISKKFPTDMVGKTQYGEIPHSAITQTEQDRIAEYFKNRLNDGDLTLEDIPVLMARYGLMLPAEFSDEMDERINLSQEDDSCSMSLPL